VARSSALVLAALLAAAVLSAGSCTQEYQAHARSIDLEVPADLERRLAAFRSGEEPWHGDPRMLADVTLRHHLDLGAAPWIAGRYRSQDYEVKHRPDWGDYVVRGYTYPSGGIMRYRVKIRRHQEIWYPVQVSRYKLHELPDDREAYPHPH
jgi:hypothetical protein